MSIKKQLLRTLLYIAKNTDLFSLTKVITRRNLRILCYHGCSLQDEHQFRPGLFMTGENFKERMRIIVAKGYPVLSLDDAIDKLRSNNLPKGATVITIDDGWYGTYKKQFPILKALQLPATIYASTHYVQHQTQVFNVCLDYLLWKVGKEKAMDLKSYVIGKKLASPSDVTSIQSLTQCLNGIADNMTGAVMRQDFLREICDFLGLQWSTIQSNRLFSFMSIEELKEIANNGIDIQLHTHRHRFSQISEALAKREIEDNRNALQGIAKLPLRHFCYPSGIFNTTTKEYLKNAEISTATTTRSGFNKSEVDFLELHRFLDSERVSRLEFEAELSGFFEIIRRSGYQI